MSAAKRARKTDPRIARFVVAYLVSMNAKQAAIDAGFPKKSAHVTGCLLLKKLNVQEALSKAEQEAQAKAAASLAGQPAVLDSLGLDLARLTPERVLEELAYVGFSDIGLIFEKGHLKDIEDLPPHVRRMVASVKVVKKNMVAGDGMMEWVHEVKLWPKLEALDKLAQHLGLLKTQVDVTLTVQAAEKMSDAQLAARLGELQEKFTTWAQERRSVAAVGSGSTIEAKAQKPNRPKR